MKKTFKACIGIILALCMVLAVPLFDKGETVHADSVSVTIALSATSVRMGQSVSATISVSGSDLSAYTMYVSYSSGILQYNSASGVVGGGGGTLTVSGLGPGSTTINFTAIENGTASISTSGSEFYNINGEALSVNHAGVNVTVATEDTQATTEEKKEDKDKDKDKDKDTEEETTETTEEDDRSDDCDLSSLSVSPGSLSPSFNPSTTSYTVNLTEEDQSIVVSAVTHDEKAKTSVSGANSLQKGTNTVSVTVTAENGAVKVYYLTVLCGKDKEDVIVQVDGHNFVVVTEDLPAAPENFTDTTITMEEEEIPAFESPNKRLTIVCLRNEEGEKFWYIYDNDKKEYSAYNEYSAEYVRYVILKKPDNFEVPEGFFKSDFKIGENSYPAYTDGTGSGVYLVYAMNIDGEAGFYFYDTKEGSFMRFAAAEDLLASVSDASKIEPATVAPVTEAPTTEAPVVPKKEEEKVEKGISRGMLKLLLVAMTVLFVIMCIAVIVLVIKNSNLQKDMDAPIDGDDDQGDDSYDLEELSDEEKAAAERRAIEDAKRDKAVAEADKIIEELSKSKSYSVNDDTCEIQLEEADDFNSSVNVPLAKEERMDKIENAKKERPYGIDSAFDVVADDSASEAETTVLSASEAETTVLSASEAETTVLSAAESAQNVAESVKASVADNVESAKAEVKAAKAEVKAAEVTRGPKVVLPGQDDEED